MVKRLKYCLRWRSIKIFALCSLLLVPFSLLAPFPLFAQQLFMQVEVRKPAEVKIGDVQHLLLINNTPLTNDMPKHCLFAAAGTFEDLERFDEVSVLANLPDSAKVDSLCARYQVDALLALNALVLSEYQANAYWTIHYPKGRSFSFFTNTDSLFCEDDNDCAAIVGEEMAYLLSPHWVTEDRYLYSNDDECIQSGLDALSRREWNDAITEWKKALGEKHETQAYASANIAVAYEMLDRFEEAIVWTKNAINAFRRIRTADAAQQVINLRYYQSQLEDRLANK